MKLLNSFGGRFKQTAVNYFVYQAKQVQIKIQAHSLEDYNNKRKRNLALFLLLFVIFNIFEIISFTYSVFEKTDNLGIFLKET